MTVIEITPGKIYCSCDDRAELLALISWLGRNYDRLETRGQRAITIYDFIDIPEPPTEKT